MLGMNVGNEGVRYIAQAIIGTATERIGYAITTLHSQDLSKCCVYSYYYARAHDPVCISK